jgi:hypothetical protein
MVNGMALWKGLVIALSVGLSLTTVYGSEACIKHRHFSI